MKSRVVITVLMHQDDLEHWKMFSREVNSSIQTSPYIILDLNGYELNSISLGYLGYFAREYERCWKDVTSGIFLIGVTAQTERVLSLLSLLRFFVIEEDYNGAFNSIKQEYTELNDKETE